MEPILSIVVLVGLVGGLKWLQKKNNKKGEEREERQYLETCKAHVADIESIENSPVEAIAMWSEQEIQELSTSLMNYQKILDNEKEIAESQGTNHVVFRKNHRTAEERIESADAKLANALDQKRSNE